MQSSTNIITGGLLPSLPVRTIILALVATLLHACGSAPVLDDDDDGPPAYPVNIHEIPDAIPKHEPRSNRGNPGSYVVFGKRYHVMDSSEGFVERGIASWYGKKFHGRRTSSGEPYDMLAMTAAHKSLPLPTYVRVTNLRNGRSVVVKVNDRGPFVKGRIIDLSYAAAKKLGVNGTAPVEIRAIEPGYTEPPVIVAGNDDTAPGRPVARPMPIPDAPVAVPLPSPDSNAIQMDRSDQLVDRSMDYEPASGQYLSTAAATVNDSRLFLQVGAFSSRENAERLRQQLLQLPVPTIHIHSIRGNGTNGMVYKVRIGPFASNHQADQVRQILDRRGHPVSRVIMDY